MKHSVAVIGAGVFGCEIALELTKMGFIVDLYERNNSILNEATAKSQNRLHLGLHYPRDLQTAVQSRIGFETFSKRFPSAVRKDFPNIYCVAREASQVNLSEFELFASNADIEIKKIDMEIMRDMGMDTNKISSSYRCNEGVIDISLLRNLLIQDLESASVQVFLATEILRCNRVQNHWELFSNQGNLKKYNLVIRATYAADQIQSNFDFRNVRNIEYHQTMIAILDSDTPSFGITVIDGDFLTILPLGFSNRFLAYAPSISVLRSHTGPYPPTNWGIPKQEEQGQFWSKLNIRIQEFMPNWNYEFSGEVLSTIRSIDPNVKKTDRRTSSISETAPNFYDVWSGKIDHCVDISKDLAKEIGAFA